MADDEDVLDSLNAGNPLPSRIDDDYIDFICEIREIIGLKEAQPAYAIEECQICCEEYEMEGDKKPMMLLCCNQNMCVACMKNIHKDSMEKKKDGSCKLGCPFCRRYPLPELIIDDKCLLKVKEREKEMDIKYTVEPLGIRCATCDKLARKPHHRFVCLTCRFQTGKWLLSGNPEDRENLKKGTLCTNCSYRHKLYHRKQKNEDNEIRPLSQLIGYTKGQIEDSSDKLQKRIKEKGYLPRSLCIMYSLWTDLTGGEIFDVETINRLIETTKSVSASLRSMPDCELKTVALSDFSVFFRKMAPDLDRWSKLIKDDLAGLKGPDIEKGSNLSGEWAYAVAVLLFNVMEFVSHMYPEAIEEIWTIYLDEIILFNLPILVRKFPVDHPNRIRTIMMLYSTCKFIEASWGEGYLAYGRLLKREMVCIRAVENYESDARLTSLLQMYQWKCTEHENWRRQVAAEARLRDVTEGIKNM